MGPSGSGSLSRAGELAPLLEGFEVLDALQPRFALQVPGGEGAHLGRHAALPALVALVALHVGKAVAGLLAEQVLLLEAGRTPPGPVEDGAPAAQMVAEGPLLRGGDAERFTHMG